MSGALAAPVEIGPEEMTLGTELLRVLTTGDVSRLKEVLSGEGRTQRADGHVAIKVNGTSSPGAGTGTGSSLGVTSNGNTALHLVASRGHAELAAFVCESAPSLVATRNKGLDTPLHCVAKAGSRGVAACLLSRMRSAAGGADEEEAAAAAAAAAALWARNRLGATALHEAVRLSRAGVVDLLMTKAPELASVATHAVARGTSTPARSQSSDYPRSGHFLGPSCGHSPGGSPLPWPSWCTAMRKGG